MSAKTAREEKKADLCPKGSESNQTKGEEGFGKEITVEGGVLA